MREVVLRQVQHHGLGDNLVFSTVPEVLSRQGYVVHVAHDVARRNDEVVNLVWGCNPYVVDYKANRRGVEMRSFTPRNLWAAHGCEGNLVRAAERWHGAVPESRYPKIYYPCATVSDLAGCILIDLSCVSAARRYNADRVVACCKQVCSQRFPELPIWAVRYRHLVFSRDWSPADAQSHEVGNIFELCDAINSCAVYITLMSGNSILANAIKQDGATPLIYTMLPPRLRPDEHGFLFDNAEYSTP